MTISSMSQNSHPQQKELIWSRSEKAVARTAFDAALGRELHEVIQKTKQMANAIQQSADLWDLEHYLSQRRKEIDRKYDYRYSRLTDVLGRLLYENRLIEDDLRGLRKTRWNQSVLSLNFLAGAQPELHSERYRLVSPITLKHPD